MHLSNVVTPAPRDVWEALFKADPEAVPYQSPNWLKTACVSGGFTDVSRLYQFSDGRQFVLPLVKTKGLPAFLSIAGSMPPGWGMGGIVGADPLTAEDMAVIYADLVKLPYLRVGIRPNPRRADLWEMGKPSTITTIPRLAHAINLEGGFETVWTQRFSKKTRKLINKAEKLGVIVKCDNTGQHIPIFYGLMKRSFDRWAKRQHEPLLLSRWRSNQRDPHKKFESIAQHLGSACQVWVAWLEDKPVAASLVLQYGNVNSSRSVMDLELMGNSAANDLIKKYAIRDACQAGCRYFHLGETGFSSGLDFYKSRFGAEAYPYKEYYIERLPITKLDRQLRDIVKRLIGFQDKNKIEVVTENADDDG